MNPNFEEYTLEELEDVESQIDKVQYPGRHKTICDLISKIQNGTHIPPSKKDNISSFNYERLVPKINPKYEPLFKVLFIIFSYVWFFISQLMMSVQPITTVVFLLFLYSLPVHWVYAYIFNTNMHSQLHNAKPNEHMAARFFGFILGIAIGIFITYPRVI